MINNAAAAADTDVDEAAEPEELLGYNTTKAEKLSVHLID